MTAPVAHANGKENNKKNDHANGKHSHNESDAAKSTEAIVHPIGSKVKVARTWRSYKESEVAAHNKEDDIWLIIHGKVYDVQTFLEDHPGGPEIMQQHGGRDATQDFEETFHSSGARSQLKDYLIGSLEGYTGADDAATATKKKTSKSSSSSSGGVSSGGINLVLVGAGIAIIAVVAYCVLI